MSDEPPRLRIVGGTANSDDLVRDLVAILLVSGEGADRTAVQRALDVDRRRLNEVLRAAREGPLTGLMIQEQDDVLRLVTHPDAGRAVRRFLQAPAIRLSGAALETLAMVAYNQPTTRAAVADARGVNSDGPIATLLQHGLIAEAGRAETPGRPTLFVTTQEFLSLVGLSSLEELPEVQGLQQTPPPGDS